MASGCRAGPWPPCRVHSASELVWGWSLMVRSPTAPSPPLPLSLHSREEVFPGGDLSSALPAPAQPLPAAASLSLGVSLLF